MYCVKFFGNFCLVLATKLREFDIRSKHGQLPVIDKIHINGWFLFKETVGSNGRKYIDNEVVEGTVPGVFNPGDILQFVIDRFFIKTCFLNRILSATLIREFLMLSFTLITGCNCPEKISDRAWLIYLLSAQNFPFTFFMLHWFTVIHFPSVKRLFQCLF